MLERLACFYVVLVILTGLKFVITQSTNSYNDLDPLSKYTASCVGAKLVRFSDLDYCNMIDWRTVNLYNTSQYTVYNPGTGLSARTQDIVARSLVAYILSSTLHSPSALCESAVKRFACVAVFPYCPNAGATSSSTSFLPPCHKQCMQVHEICKMSYFDTASIVSLDCSAYPVDHNCVVKVPKDRFLLLPELGPYESIPGIYMVMLAIWAVLNGLWTYYVFMKLAESALPVSKALLSLLPIARLLIAAFSLIFWLDCVATADMCESTRAAVMYIVFPIVEAVQIYVYMAVAKGWSVTRAYLPLDVWRFHIALCFGFYVTLTVLSGTLDVPSGSWILYSVVLYGVMYLLILNSALKEMAVLSSQVKALTPGMAAVAAEPLREKHLMFRRFLLLVFLALLLEGLCRYLYASRSVPFYVLILVYEGGSTVLVVCICWLYRPRELSPFFFMVPTSLEHGALLSDEDGAEHDADDDDWRDRRDRSRALSRRGHSREREDDVATIERLRLTRVQRPSPMVEISLLGEESEVFSPLDPTGAAVDAESMRRLSRTRTAAASPTHHEGDIELNLMSNNGGSAGARSGPDHAVRPAQAAESLDLTRLVASLLVSPTPGPGQQRRAQAAAEMADLGLGGDREGVGTAPAAAAAAASVTEGAPVSFWRRAPAGSTRMIALTSPDQQEVMLAIHRSSPAHL